MGDSLLARVLTSLEHKTQREADGSATIYFGLNLTRFVTAETFDAAALKVFDAVFAEYEDRRTHDEMVMGEVRPEHDH